MLNVPDRIKELLHTDSVNKNIRIHFPNGERSDICNDLIVQDSVQFKESLCSQDKLKFGLCEAPAFECEVVGVGNIKGATIDVFCEIYCSADTEDAEWRTDIQQYVYSIPYGTFIVSTAKRQADMIHRKIVAYGILSELTIGMTLLQKKRALYNTSTSGQFVQNAISLISEKIQSNAFFLSENELTLTEYVGIYSRPYGGSGIGNYWEMDTYYCLCYKITQSNSGVLYHIKTDVNIPKERYGFARLFSGGTTPYVGGAGVKYWPITAFLHSNSPITYDFLNSSEEWGTNFVYPYMSISENTFFTKNDGVYLFVCYKHVYELYRHTSGGWDEVATKTDIYCNPSDVHMYSITLPLSLPYVADRVSVGSGVYAVPDVDEINLRKIFDGTAEIYGAFLGVDRFNQFYLKNIKRLFGLIPQSNLYPDVNLYPESVTGGKIFPEDYQTCWYDDDYMMPFGKIVVNYKSANNDTVEYNYFLEGYDADSDISSYRVYTINDNEIIRNTTWTESQILQICQTTANNIGGVSYMPVEFKGRGLPYVEAGDTFEILTKSNDSITTIVLNRTINGEQHLVDSYKSV